MYLPAHFRQDELSELHHVITAFPLATLVTNGPDGMVASHVPMLLDPADGPYGKLTCHLARANAQWQSAANGEALVIFNGPQAYITPNWYAAKTETGRVVPTWNYIAVHARGTIRVFTDAAELYTLVARLTDVHEAAEAQPWAPADAPERFMRDQLQGIVGLEIPIRSLLGKWKLSQNRPAGDRRRIVAGLAQRPDADARATADTMTSLPLHEPEG